MRIRPRYIIYTFFVLVFVLVMALTTIYTTGTEYGDCVGLGQTRMDSLVYEPNIPNIMIAVLGFQTGIIPAYIVLTSLECPVRVK